MRHSNLDETVNKEKLKNCLQEALVILVKTLKVLFGIEKVRFEKKRSVKIAKRQAGKLEMALHSVLFYKKCLYKKQETIIEQF